MESITGEQLSTLANDLSSFYRRFYGRGPESAKCVAADDIVICRLRDSMTPAEQMLVENNRVDQVQQMRMLFQRAARTEIVDIAERVLETSVATFSSAWDVSSNTDFEIFVLRDDT
jgi:uncharacterized protein YbcI